MEEGVASRRGSAARYALVWRWRVGLVLTSPRPTPLPPRPRPALPPPSPEVPARKVQRIPCSRPEGGANKRPFLSAAAPDSWTAARGVADNPGACGRGRGGSGCQGDPGAGRRLRLGAGRAGGAGGGGTMSGRKRSFTFGAYGG